MIVLLKKLLAFCAVLFIALAAAGQTVLPTSWQCNPGTLPNGWSTDVVSYYTSSSYTHSPPNAIKFEADNMFLTIHFVDEPDTLYYYLRGASFSGGTFTVQQSTNGTSWTALRTFTNTNIPNTSLASALPFKEVLGINTRFVRFIYTQKVSGNVCVDDIMIGKLPPGPEASIKIKINNQFVPSGGMAIIGNAATVACRVINAGTDSVLRITASNIAGTNAAMFNVSGIPLNIPPNDSADFTLHFTATGADGSKTALLSLTNNDLDKNPYVLNIWGVKGCCATEPTHSATNISFSYVKSFKFRVNFDDNVSIPEKYLMLKKTSPITEEPLDGQTYLQGDYIGGAQVAYIGDAGYYYPANVIAGTPYYIKIFSCNGYPGYENYLTNGAPAIDTITPDNMIGTYYDGIDVFSTTLWQDLHALINPHTQMYYDDYDLYMINDFESRDTVVDGRSQKALSCVYSGENYVYTPPFAFNVYSREHAFCQSWMASVDAPNFTSLPEYSDYHNLFPVNQNKVNVYRLNYPLGLVDSITYQYLACKKGFDSLGHIVFEPKDDIKGDVARAMFYHILCYDGVDGRDWYLPVLIDSTSTAYGQSEALLKQWNAQDPPDKYEMARNDNIDYWQHNRNPFVDHPEWVDWFGFGVNSSVGEVLNHHGFSVYPNPSQGIVTVVLEDKGDAQFELYDMAGAIKFSTLISAGSQHRIDLSNFAGGMYFYRIRGNEGEIRNGKLVIGR